MITSWSCEVYWSVHLRNIILTLLIQWQGGSLAATHQWAAKQCCYWEYIIVMGNVCYILHISWCILWMLSSGTRKRDHWSVLIPSWKTVHPERVFLVRTGNILALLDAGSEEWRLCLCPKSAKMKLTTARISYELTSWSPLIKLFSKKWCILLLILWGKDIMTNDRAFSKMTHLLKTASNV